MNTNLFLPNPPTTPEDLVALLLCNEAAAYKPWIYRSLFYQLKDRLLLLYGEFDGYDLQEWYSFRWGQPCEYNPNGLCSCNTCEIFHTHRHILARYWFGGHLFHKPTGDFALYSGEAERGFCDVSTEQYAIRYHSIKHTLRGKKVGSATPIKADQHFLTLIRKFHYLFIDAPKVTRLEVEKVRQQSRIPPKSS